MAKPLYEWHSVHSIHKDTMPPPKGRVWWVAKYTDRKRPSLLVQRGNTVSVAAHFANEEEALAFADLLGGIQQHE